MAANSEGWQFKKEISIGTMGFFLLQFIDIVIWSVRLDAYNSLQDIKIQQNRDDLVQLTMQVEKSNNANIESVKTLAKFERLGRLEQSCYQILTEKKK